MATPVSTADSVNTTATLLSMLRDLLPTGPSIISAATRFIGTLRYHQKEGRTKWHPRNWTSFNRPACDVLVCVRDVFRKLETSNSGRVATERNKMRQGAPEEQNCQHAPRKTISECGESTQVPVSAHSLAEMDRTEHLRSRDTWYACPWTETRRCVKPFCLIGPCRTHHLL